jgi:hypothetical protein
MQVEKVRYAVNWREFKVGRSIFIPCLSPQTAWTELHPVFKRLKYNTVHKVCIEDGVRGLRIWRVSR